MSVIVDSSYGAHTEGKARTGRCSGTGKLIRSIAHSLLLSKEKLIAFIQITSGKHRLGANSSKQEVLLLESVVGVIWDSGLSNA